jgi:hypothetical protein
MTATFKTTGAQAGELKLFIDGRLVDAKPTRGDSSQTDTYPNLKIGTRGDRPDDYKFHGLIDDVLILRRALGDEEVAAMHRAGRADDPINTSVNSAVNDVSNENPEHKETVK